MNSLFIGNYIKLENVGFKLLAKLLNGEQDFNPINPLEDGYFYHLSTLKKFLDGSLEFDIKPTEEQLNEVQQIVSLMSINRADFLYLIN